MTKQTTSSGHVILEWGRNGSFDFTEIVNQQGLKCRPVCQIVKFISHFSLKLHIQFLKTYS